MTPATHYRHSHRVSILLFPVALAVSAALGVVSALVYAYSMVYVPVAQLAFVLPLLYGAAMGAGVGWIFKQCKVRSSYVTTFGAFAFTAVSYALSWLPWTYATLARQEVEVTWLDVLFPPSFVQLVGMIYEYGAWSIGSGGEPVKGVMLGVCWVMEALFVLGLAPVIAAAVASHGVFCEKCERWCTLTADLMRLDVARQADLKQRLDAQDLRVIDETPRAPSFANPFLRLDLISCTGCGETHALTVKQVTRTQESKREQVQETMLVDHVLLSREQADWLRRSAA